MSKIHSLGEEFLYSKETVLGDPDWNYLHSYTIIPTNSESNYFPEHFQNLKKLSQKFLSHNSDKIPPINAFQE
jgi:hypothetical protein